MEIVYGTMETPVFMNVGTMGAIKGTVSTDDLREIGAQAELSNTYHLHMCTSDKLIREFGGLHRFMNWDRPILTDPGGFQVLSLAGLRKTKGEGACFNSRISGHRIFMGPKESIQIQSSLGSTVAMALDRYPPSHVGDDCIRHSAERTIRWLARCKTEMERLNSLSGTVNRQQLLLGINQDGVVDEIRMEHARTIREMDLDGYVVGRLAVSESHKEVYHTLDVTVPYLSEDKSICLVGAGTPVSILEAVDQSVDSFDCVHPSRDGRHDHVHTNQGKLNLFNQKHELNSYPIEEGCGCPACRSYSRAYIRHLLRVKGMLGMRSCTLHNLYFYNIVVKEIRDAVREHRYVGYKAARLAGMEGSDRAVSTVPDE